MVVAFPVGMVAFFTGEIFELHEVQFLYGTGLMLVFSTAIFVAVTLATPAPDRAEISVVVFDRATWREESEGLRDEPWYRNYRWLSLAILIATVAAVTPFV
jgi:solute:Na+ symporter, SSS family